MRLSITLDPKLHQITAARARARRTSISQEINELLRQAIAAPADTFSAPAPALAGDPASHRLDPATGLLISAGKRRFPVSPGRSPLTSEDLLRMEDDEDLRHMKA